MDENVIIEEWQETQLTVKQMKTTLQSREQLREAARKSKRRFLRRQETWAPKHGWRVHPREEERQLLSYQRKEGGGIRHMHPHFST